MKKQSRRLSLSYLSDSLPEFILRANIEETLKPIVQNVYSRRVMEFYDNSGKGPKRVKIGRHIAYKRNDLIDWLEKQIVTLQ